MTTKQKLKNLSEKFSDNEIVIRTRAKTPKFWKKMQILGAGIAGIGLIITSVPVVIPISLTSWGSYLLTVGGTITTISQLTKE
jgi:hypothetical protein